jgi:hypothetical protein
MTIALTERPGLVLDVPGDDGIVVGRRGMPLAPALVRIQLPLVRTDSLESTRCRRNLLKYGSIAGRNAKKKKK